MTQVRITENRTEYQTRSYDVDLPATIDKDDAEAVQDYARENGLGDLADWDTVSAYEDIASVETLPDVYLVMVYYNRQSDAIGAGGCEPYGARLLEADAIELARGASARDAGQLHPHTYVVEGGRYEPGACDGPAFVAGERTR